MGLDVYRFRICCVLLVLVVLFGALSRHLYSIQIARHDELFDKARAKYTSRQTEHGQRGEFYDRNGHLLVGNLACQDVLAEPRRIPSGQRQYVIDTLSERLGVDRQRLLNRFESGRIEVVVRTRVPLRTATDLQELKLPGIRFVDNWRRYYPKKQLLANALGFVNSKGGGVYGLEAVWNDALIPREATEVYERDRKGQRLYRQSPVEGETLNGQSIYLTIDEPIQGILESELKALVDKHAPRYAYAIMADPKTGGILAMGQLPSYDPNDRSTMRPERWRNHIVSDVYDPGSTMKCIAIAGAVDYGVVGMNSVFDCEQGYWRYGGRPLRDTHGYGRLSVATILQKSSNIGTAKIALKMGRNRLYQTLRRFGFGERTKIGLQHESAGILRKPARWDGLSITRFPIGQGVSVTPLQMVQSYCALANQGTMMQLHLVDRLVDPNNGKVTDLQPQVRHLAARPRAVKAVVAAMKTVTQEGGTAGRAAIPGYEVAGKTGTSQKLVNGSYSGHGKYIASFIGFVPAEDPALVLLVIADEPTGKYYGGTVCGPTFRNIAERTLRYLNVPPVRNAHLAQADQ